MEVNRSRDYLTLLKAAWLTLEAVDSSQDYVMFCIVSKELLIKNWIQINYFAKSWVQDESH